LSAEAATVRNCGRPTKSGAPCRARVYGSDVACTLHTTDVERQVTEAHRRGYYEGYEQGRKSNEDAEKLRVEWLERRVRELEQKLDDAARYFELDGDQAVEVGRYSYRWSGSPPLKVGDRVLLPENWLSRIKDGSGPTEGVVTQLGATYRGSLSHILRRVE
jgi:hypothetical protein